MTISLLRSLLLSCTMLTLTAAQTGPVNANDRPALVIYNNNQPLRGMNGDSDPLSYPAENQFYYASAAPFLRQWPPSEATGPKAVFKIAGATDWENCNDMDDCFDLSITGGPFTISADGFVNYHPSVATVSDSTGTLSYRDDSWNPTIVVTPKPGRTGPDQLLYLSISTIANVLGCTDENAYNHDPNANTDDTSCAFCAEVLNADVYTCDAIGASGIQSVTCSSGYLETGLAGDDLGCTACPDTGVQCCQNAALHATSTTCSGGGYNDIITSVTCDTGYSESGSVTGGDLGCTLSCEAREQEWLADCACTVDSVDCVAKKNAWTNAGCEPQTCG